MRRLVLKVFGWWLLLALLTLCWVAWLEPGPGSFGDVWVKQLRIFGRWLLS